MSNLHKDLQNDQIHNPKDFSTAANDTKLTKNSSGNLEWVADTGGGVSQIIAGTNVTISPTGGTGNVTINASGGGSSIESISNSWRGCYEHVSGGRSVIGYVLNSPCMIERSSSFLHGTAIGDMSGATIAPVMSSAIVGGGIHVVDSANPTNERWVGRMICGAGGAAGEFSLCKATLVCEGEQPSGYTLTKLISTAFNMSSNGIFCWDLETEFAASITKGDIIVPVIGSAGSETFVISYTTSLRLKQ